MDISLGAYLLLPLLVLDGIRPVPPVSPARKEPVPVTTAAVAAAPGTALRLAGVAAWYGEGFQGRKTASGELFDLNGYTAAHLTLPFGTCVRVRHVCNGRCVIVRINDRGPYGGGRIIDLSQAAAREIGIYRKGRCKVELEVLPAGALPGPAASP